jgi:predicted RNA-binding Zn-ribbon protein involved in translation (DUF1610 family)
MDDVSLDNHLTKCRICFKSLNKRQSVDITEDIRNLFLSITQINLRKSQIYATQICVDCNKTMAAFNSFKNNIIHWQTKLYDEYPDDDDFIKPEFLQIDIKIKQEEEEELLRDNLIECHLDQEEPADESNLDKPKKKRGGSRSKGGPASKQRRICPDCGSTVMDLSRHWRRSHSNIINFICDICGYGALMRHRIINHMRNKHLPKENRAKFQCRACDFQTVNRSYLLIHEKSHSVRPSEFKCHCHYYLLFPSMNKSVNLSLF